MNGAIETNIVVCQCPFCNSKTKYDIDNLDDKIVRNMLKQQVGLNFKIMDSIQKKKVIFQKEIEELEEVCDVQHEYLQTLKSSQNSLEKYLTSLLLKNRKMIKIEEILDLIKS